MKTRCPDGLTLHSAAVQGREHLKFLLRLEDVMPLRSAFLRQLEAAVAKQGFELQVSF